MVARHSDPHARPNHYLLIQNHGNILSPPDREDARLRRIDDGRELMNPKHPKIRDREGSPSVLIGLELLLPRTASKLFDLATDLREPLEVGVFNDRSNQPVLDGHRNAHMNVLEATHGVAVPLHVALGMTP